MYISHSSRASKNVFNTEEGKHLKLFHISSNPLYFFDFTVVCFSISVDHLAVILVPQTIHIIMHNDNNNIYHDDGSNNRRYRVRRAVVGGFVVINDAAYA